MCDASKRKKRNLRSVYKREAEEEGELERLMCVTVGVTQLSFFVVVALPREIDRENKRG